MNQTPMRTLGVALIVIAIALGVAGLLLGKRPARYEATALVKVERDKVDLPELTGFPELAATAASVKNTYFIQTEIAVIQSEATLDKVITRLDLNQVWGNRLYDGQKLKTSETFQMLKGRLQVQPGPDAALILIKAVSEIATEAAEIANATAQAYCDYRADYRRRLAQTALDAIAGRYAEMEKQIAAAREKVDEAGLQLDPALREQAAAGQPTAESDSMRKLHARYAESVLRYLALSNQLARYQPKNAGNDELAEQLKAKAGKAQAEMVAAETATRSEMRRLESLKAYQAARLELEDLNQRFAPLKRTVEGLQNDLRPQGRASARVVEQATPPTTPAPRGASREGALLPGAGVVFATGVGLLLFGRKPKNPAA